MCPGGSNVITSILTGGEAGRRVRERGVTVEAEVRESDLRRELC